MKNTSRHHDAPTGLVFNVQGYSVHDGPGIRVEFFMKGCPLRCEWCSNPEGISPAREPGAYPDKCLGIEDCGACLAACPQGALLFAPDGTLDAVDRAACIGCLACTEACLTGALSPWGITYTVDEAMDIIRRDRPFFERSGGGVTISGGEALLQPHFAQAVFEQCRTEGINTCLESALFVSPQVLEPFLPLTDLWIADIKHRDPAIHLARCGVSNGPILANLRLLAQRGARLVVRTPVVKGFNATDEAMAAIGRFILDDLGNRVLQHQLLPYRQLGTEKYASLGRDYPMAGFEGYERKQWEPDLRRFIALLQDMGVNAVSGNNQRLK
jgi:pyruvate formate lyase activating enzyme